MGNLRSLFGTAAALASLAALSTANATIVITPIAAENTGAFDDNSVGTTNGSTLTSVGMMSFQTTTGAVANGTNTNVNAKPAGDNSNYLWDLTGATMTFAECGSLF